MIDRIDNSPTPVVTLFREERTPMETKSSGNLGNLSYNDILNVSWGGRGYGDYAGYGNTPGTGAPAAPAVAPAAAPSTSGAPSGTGAPPASPTGTGPGAQPVPSTGTGGTLPGSPTGPSPNPNDPNLGVIRASHDLVQRFGGPEKVTAAVERYNTMYTASRELATNLGYTPESFEDAFGQAPVEIYNHLMAEARAADRGDDNGGRGQPSVQDLINRELNPIRQFATRQMAREANQSVDTEFGRLFNDHNLFKGKSVPAEVKDAIFNQFTDLVKWDNAAQSAVLKGDVSKLQAHFDAAVANMVKFTNGWTKWTTGSPTQGNGNGQGTGAPAAPGTPDPNPFNLNDIIEGNDNATKGMSSLRGFR